ncbi:MAG: DUF1365 family protein [Legionellales bacterium]|nr:DUF1365 family protein [Legionellales bacterium]
MITNALYSGQIVHHRLLPHEHRFYYPLEMVCLDLEHLESLCKPYWFCAYQRFHWLSLKRRHHLSSSTLSWYQSVKQCAKPVIQQQPTGRIYLLTQLAYCGWVFNPLSVYFIFNADHTRIMALVLEITHTPGGHRHHYVLPPLTQSFAHTYTTQLIQPLPTSSILNIGDAHHVTLKVLDEKLTLSLQDRQRDQMHSLVYLTLQSLPLPQLNLVKLLWRYPRNTLIHLPRLYWQLIHSRRSQPHDSSTQGM